MLMRLKLRQTERVVRNYGSFFLLLAIYIF
jgi:hypothetical protein